MTKPTAKPPTKKSNKTKASKPSKTARKSNPPVAKVGAGASAKTPGSAGAGLPQSGAPSPPAGWTAPVKVKGQKARPGLLPTLQQIRDAGDVARELASPNYQVDFGSFAPDQGLIVEALKEAKAWADEEQAAELWHAYTSSESDAKWKAALGLTTKLQKQYETAITRNSKIPGLYPETADFLNVHKVSAAKGAQTRAKNKAAKKGPPDGK